MSSASKVVTSKTSAAETAYMMDPIHTELDWAFKVLLRTNPEVKINQSKGRSSPPPSSVPSHEEAKINRSKGRSLPQQSSAPSPKETASSQRSMSQQPMLQLIGSSVDNWGRHHKEATSLQGKSIPHGHAHHKVPRISLIELSLDNWGSKSVNCSTATCTDLGTLASDPIQQRPSKLMHLGIVVAVLVAFIVMRQMRQSRRAPKASHGSGKELQYTEEPADGGIPELCGGTLSLSPLINAEHDIERDMAIIEDMAECIHTLKQKGIAAGKDMGTPVIVHQPIVDNPLRKADTVVPTVCVAGHSGRHCTVEKVEFFDIGDDESDAGTVCSANDLDRIPESPICIERFPILTMSESMPPESSVMNCTEGGETADEHVIAQQLEPELEPTTSRLSEVEAPHKVDPCLEMQTSGSGSPAHVHPLDPVWFGLATLDLFMQTLGSVVQRARGPATAH